ncbi:MAG: sensor histidine kinase [Alphaproteobacteria bacterium]
MAAGIPSEVSQASIRGRREVGTPNWLPGLLDQYFSLRWVLFVAFTLISTIPVGLLALWLERSAYDKELAEVSERHLLLARNLSYALDRYSRDVEAVFVRAVAEMDADLADDHGLEPLLAAMGFEHICIVGADGAVESKVMIADEREIGGLPPLGPLRALALTATGSVAFSGVLANGAGTPTLYTVKDLGAGRVAIGALHTGYLVEVQKAIAFGERGHSAIVDQHGRVLAHPNEGWRLEMKDISKISAVKRMIANETGVATFYSPAMDADMIAGFTSVARTGWGVMVPQPLAELAAHANQVQSISTYVGLLGLLIATVLAWLMARYLARPIERVARVAEAVSAGDVDARVTGMPRLIPEEINAMSIAFNQMLSDLAKTTATLRATAREAEAASRAKSKFMANMSHEFRTPLNAIMGFSDVMQSRTFGPLGDERYESYAAGIHRSGSHLLAMIDEILDLTRVEAGKMELERGDVDIGEAVDFAVELLSGQAREGNVKLSTEIEADLPVLHTDAGKLRQIIVNLLSNAVKFTRPGGNATVIAKRDPDWAVVITVNDNGIGIDEADIAKVMAPFGQVASALIRNHGGTGLGLPLTAELAALMGGEFELRSAPGYGTSAIVRLPRQAPASPAVDCRRVAVG